MNIRFKNTETYIKSFAETKLIQYFLESYQASRQRTGDINAPVESSGAGGSSLNVKTENNGLDINLYGNAYLQGVDEGTAPFSPNVDAIKSWIRQKPVQLKDYKTGKLLENTPANIASVAYKIGKAISIRGIAPANYIREVVEKAFENIVDGMLPPLKEDVKDKLDEILTSVGYTKQGDTYVFKGK
jgi:hypothetical protein